MSLALCLRKGKGVLTQEDADLVRQLTDEFVADGMKPAEAATRAVDEVIALARDERNDVISTISIRGAMVPVGDGPQFIPNWGDDTRFSPAWHGTPHNVDKFSTDKINTGEGNQTYGYGLYFTDTKAIAEMYRDNVKDRGKVRDLNEQMSAQVKIMNQYETSYRKYSDPKGYEAAEKYDALMEERDRVTNGKGNLYKVELAPKENEYLLWDEELRKQPEAMKALGVDPDKKPLLPNRLTADMSGQQVYDALARGKTNLGVEATKQAASDYLHSIGIRGIKYRDGLSRTKGGETYNYVIFSDDDVAITEQFSPRQGTEALTKPPTREDGTIELTHWSHRPGIQEFDPNRSGEGIAGAEEARKRQDPKNWVNRTYYGIAPKQKGGYIRERLLGPNEYKASIHESRLYNLSDDPDNIKGWAEEQAGYTMSVAEKRIKELGYAGYWSQHPRMGLVAAVFEPLPVESETKSFYNPDDYRDAAFSPKQDDVKTESSEFKKWFGDSQVVDGEGKPLVVYHGTETGGFTEFEHRDRGSPGFFFSESRDHATSYSGRRVEDFSPIDPEAAFKEAVEGDGTVEGYDLEIQVNEVDEYYSDATEETYTVWANGYEELTEESKEEVLRYLREDFRPSAETPMVYEAYLSIKDPLIIDWEGNNWDDGPTETVYELRNDDGDVIEVFYDKASLKEGRKANPELRVAHVKQRVYETTDDALIQAEEMGFDGVIISNVVDPGPHDYFDTSTVYAVLDPAQIKSIHNYGAWNPNNSDILFTPRAGDVDPDLTPRQGEPNQDVTDFFEPEPTFQAPERMSTWDKIITALVDKYHALTKTQKAIGSVTEDKDVDLAVIRFPGMTRARIDDFENVEQKELFDRIQTSGLEFKQVAEYLHARHAEEANAVLQRRNPNRKDNESLSGMTNDRAAEILSKYENNPDVQAIGEYVDEMNRARLQMLVAEDLLTQGEADAWAQNYSHYVPLHREEAGFDLPRRGKGFDIRGKESKLRTGSTRAVDYDNMIAHILTQHEVMINRAEKNKVGQAMYRLVDENPNEALWSTTDMPQSSYLKADGTAAYRPNIQDPNILSVKFKGENKYIYFKPDNAYANQMVSALKNMESKTQGPIVQTLLTINRFLAAVNTSLSPEFVISNFFRDFQTAAYNLTDTEIKNLEMKVLKGVPKSMAGIRNALRGDGTHEWATYFDEFRREGGMTGWMQSYEDIEARMKSIRRQLKIDKTMGLRHIKGIFKAIGDYNTVVENGVRLSAYKHARDAGISRAKASKIAKELTVNFNRRGEWGIVANAMYLFYNASVQGSVRLLRAVGNKKNHRLHKMVAATVTFAAVLDMINRMATGDDDDDKAKSKYDMVREKYGDRNLIIMDWLGVTDDEDGVFFKIPLPWGYNVFHILGQEIGGGISHAMGDYPDWKPWDSTTRLLGSTLEAFNPTQDGSLLQTLAPTIVDPLVRIAENKDWHGGPLYPNYNKNAPNYTKFYSNARKESRAIAEWLNEATIDKETRKAWIDVSPEWLDMGYDFLTGSLGRFAADTKGMTEKLITGESWEYREFPVVRKMVGELGASGIKTEFYDAYYGILDMDTDLRRLSREDTPEEYKAALAGVGDRVKVIPIAKATKKQLNKMKKQLKIAEKAGNQKLVNQIEARQLDLMKLYIKRYRNIIYAD